MNILRLLTILFLVPLLILSISFPVTAEGSLTQGASTPAPDPATPELSDDGTTVTGEFFVALFAIVTFTCISIMVLVVLLWFLNNRRQSR